MKRNYTVSCDQRTGLWYAHAIGFDYIPVAGSFSETKGEAMEYARMCDGLPNRVSEIEKLREKGVVEC